MQRIGLFGGFMFLVVIVTAAVSYSDSAAPPSLPTSSPPEPITGVSVDVPAPGAGPAHQPFTPYPIGPAPGDTSPKPFWAYEDLSSQEKAVVDRGRDVANWQQVNDAYARMAVAQAKESAASRAQNQLGVENLAAQGVVP